MVTTYRFTLNGREQYITRLKTCADHENAGLKRARLMKSRDLDTAHTTRPHMQGKRALNEARTIPGTAPTPANRAPN